jgi:hypothetical protein
MDPPQWAIVSSVGLLEKVRDITYRGIEYLNLTEEIEP